MNEVRRDHASCALGERIYVISGQGHSSNLSSIEWLDTNDIDAGWSLIEYSRSLLCGMRAPAIATFKDDDSIMIIDMKLGVNKDVKVYN